MVSAKVWHRQTFKRGEIVARKKSGTVPFYCIRWLDGSTSWEFAGTIMV